MATRKKTATSEKKLPAKNKKKRPAESPKDAGFYIVGIGASAGGLEAFEKFFKNMPSNPGMAFILVPHLDRTHVSLMPELIQKCSKMKVLQVKDGIEVNPNAVHIVPPNNDLAIINATLQLLDPAQGRGPRLPIDYFLRSLAQDQGDKAVGVILSGMGTDGTLGLRAIKEELGMAMVQDPATAKYDGMPRSAVDTDLVDYILPPEQMPQQLLAYAKHASQKPAPKLVPTGGKAPNALQKIFILLRSHTGHDFSGYKQTTVCRRIERRMNVHQIDKISNYVRYLQENSLEGNILFKELLIGVTNFFRDLDAFEVLKKKSFLQILQGKPKDYVIRAWIPGCSSGEEAYSIAIILRECTERLKQHVGIQIFATDIDSNAIDTARAGGYPESIAADVSADRLKRFFTLRDNVYRVRKDIREMLVFAPQDILKDPPFTKLDLICCRNLLIYLDQKAQNKLLPLFHYSLKSDGILFLGSSETIGGCTDLFAPVDKKWKIFRRLQSPSNSHPVVEFPVAPAAVRNKNDAEIKPLKINIRQLAEKALLESYAPPGVIIDSKGEILYVHGRTGRYLEPAPGEAKWNIYDMAREDLKLELLSAIRQAGSEKSTVTSRGLQVRSNGETQTLNLTVRPLGTPATASGLMIVVFEAISPARPKTPGRKGRARGNKTDQRVEALEKELHYNKENLQITIEELETTNEELKSTNEELQSTNEELQSTNEELETTKEEQQSLNEELVTVNSELQSKIEELTTANNDMKNLLDSIDIPTIFLDMDLCIKRYTSHATRVINLIHTDIGRPIEDIATRLLNVHLAEDARAVINDLAFREKEVQSKDGRFYSIRTAPYRTSENVIDGVVITFVDVSQAKRLEIERRLVAVVRDSNDAVTIQDLDGNIKAWNRGAEKMYGYSEAEALDMHISEIIPQKDYEAALKIIARITAGKEVQPYKTKRKTKDGRILEVWLTATKLVDDQDKPVEIATTERDLAWLAKT
ncbi:Multidomain signal transduction protein including CheB-like methylesterase, CheR-like methyltransferase and BaeS-like histidine kinase [Olavius sp. associated proteobacterium Delta 1]|nr:Multidomain signal transduction protein including CheB-like methylesterase, CheR-like methyltransferase and BaeS-like histidine kinase [Olavius sp. associated proteobacterium Delta 1]